MITKKQIKLIHSLGLRKYRLREKLYVAEGPKLVGELLDAGYSPAAIFATNDWKSRHRKVFEEDGVVNVLDYSELSSASLQQHPSQVLALFPIMEHVLPDDLGTDHLVLALDGIQDPGNMGTICRIADWFGIEDIVCSNETVDVYNPKAVQATMGAIARVRVHYCDLADCLANARDHGVPVYGTLLDGGNIYDSELSVNGIIVMGNEGNGISGPVRSCVTQRLLIPNYPTGRITTESLNVAIATAITVAEFRRRRV